MVPDKAAELLQIEERGLDLLQMCLDDGKIKQAIELVQAGFDPGDVAKKLNLEWDESKHVVEEERETTYKVWGCETQGCRQKGRVSTGASRPNCPGCSNPMSFVLGTNSELDFAHMKRTFVQDPGIRDPLSRTDRTKAPHYDGS